MHMQSAYYLTCIPAFLHTCIQQRTYGPQGKDTAKGESAVYCTWKPSGSKKARTCRGVARSYEYPVRYRHRATGRLVCLLVCLEQNTRECAKSNSTWIWFVVSLVKIYSRISVQ